MLCAYFCFNQDLKHEEDFTFTRNGRSSFADGLFAAGAP